MLILKLPYIFNPCVLYIYQLRQNNRVELFSCCVLGMLKGSAMFTQDRENCLAFYRVRARVRTHTYHTHTHTEPKRCWCDNRAVCKIWYAVANQFERFSLEHKCSTAYWNTLQLVTTALEACTVKLAITVAEWKGRFQWWYLEVYSAINNIKYRSLPSSVCMRRVRGWTNKVTCYAFTENFVIPVFTRTYSCLCLLFRMSGPCLFGSFTFWPLLICYLSKSKVKVTQEQVMGTRSIALLFL